MSTGIMMISNDSSRNADSYPSEKSLVYGLCRVGTSLTWVYLDSLLSLRVNLSLLKPSPPTWPTSFYFLLANFPRNPGIKLVSAEDGLVGKAIPAPRAGYKEFWNDWSAQDCHCFWVVPTVTVRSVPKIQQMPIYSVWCPCWFEFLLASQWTYELGLWTYSSLSAYSGILPLFIITKPSVCHYVIRGNLSHTTWRPLHKCRLGIPP